MEGETPPTSTPIGEMGDITVALTPPQAVDRRGRWAEYDEDGREEGRKEEETEDRGRGVEADRRVWAPGLHEPSGGLVSKSSLYRQGCIRLCISYASLPVCLMLMRNAYALKGCRGKSTCSRQTLPSWPPTLPGRAELAGPVAGRSQSGQGSGKAPTLIFYISRSNSVS